MTNLNTIGEIGLLNRIAAAMPGPVQPTTRLGFGDDAAVFDLDEFSYGLFASALLLEGVQFDLTYFPLQHLGYKAVSTGVAKIAAMNGLPMQLSLSVGMSSRFTLEAVDALYEGVRGACEAYGVDWVGGDITTSRVGLTLAVSVTGRVSKDKITYRDTAKPNDVLCVTGDLGAAYLGLQLLEREKQEFLANPDMQPALTEETAYLVQRQLRPEARTDTIHELRDLGILPTAMIGVPDGLAAALLHLCQDSKTGAIIFDNNLPIDDQSYLTATEFSISPITAALNGGDDYELLFTVPPAEFEKLKNSSRVTAVGYLTNDPAQVILATKAGQQTPIRAQGFQ